MRLPYREPSGLFDGAAESVWDVRTWHGPATGAVTTRDYNYRAACAPMDAAASVLRPAEVPRPVIPGTLPARVESREKNDIYAHLDEQGRYRVKLDFDREGTEAGYGYLWLRMAKPTAGGTLGWHAPLIDGTGDTVADNAMSFGAAGTNNITFRHQSSQKMSIKQHSLCVTTLKTVET